MPLGRPSFLGYFRSTLAGPEVLFGREGQLGSEDRRCVEVQSPEKDLARPGQESEERWKPDFPESLAFCLFIFGPVKSQTSSKLLNASSNNALHLTVYTGTTNRSLKGWSIGFQVIKLLLAMLSCVMLGYQGKNQGISARAKTSGGVASLVAAVSNEKAKNQNNRKHKRKGPAPLTSRIRLEVQSGHWEVWGTEELKIATKKDIRNAASFQ
jgi:hypothetical protein